MAFIRSVAFAVAFAVVGGVPCVARASISVSPTIITSGGSYTVSWTDTSGGYWHAYLRESVNGGTWSKTAVTGTYSKTYTGKPVGTYAYKVQIYFYDKELGGEDFDHETNVVTAQVVPAGAPGMPGAITGPDKPSTSSYTLSWGAASGAVTRYDLRENGVVAYGDSIFADSAASTSASTGGWPRRLPATTWDRSWGGANLWLVRRTESGTASDRPRRLTQTVG